MARQYQIMSSNDNIFNQKDSKPKKKKAIRNVHKKKIK